MICTNGHNNELDARFCSECGIDTFQSNQIAQNEIIPSMSMQPTSNKTNGFAVASLVLGVVWIFGAGSILAIIFGFIASNQIKERGEKGSGMATAGIILGVIGVILLVVFLSSTNGSSNGSSSHITG
jgi:uncharacterized membrane protein